MVAQIFMAAEPQFKFNGYKYFSHRLNDVFAVSDRIITLSSGRVIADNLTKDVSMQQIMAQIMGV